MSSFREFPALKSGGTTYRLYESRVTGIRGLLMETGEPLCSIHVAIATESDSHDWTHKDDGLPHTLEHAVFMGSDLYPYKGILDKLANRSLARGTNAWTATDHTCYTMTSAGHEGCLNLLPIYADHILYPTLTDECFYTEVHHVTAEGEDKGVVYCEMQARENSSGSLVDRAILELLYPVGGYSSETGGKMANLRSLTNAQVSRYHRELYRPDNVCFILSGTAGAEEFLAAMELIEKRVLVKTGCTMASQLPRPWSLPVAPVATTDVPGILTGAGAEGTYKSVPFPSEDESTGVVSMGWRGPKYDDHGTWMLVKLLWTYLTEGAVAPLTKALVEIEKPLCSRVAPADEVFSEGYHQVWFRDAKVGTLEEIPKAFFAELQKAIQTFDLERMSVVIAQRRRRTLEQLERAPTDASIRSVIEHFLYAARGPDDAAAAAEMATLAAGVDALPHLEAAEKVSVQDWADLVRTYILDQPCATVIGRPQASLATEIAAEVGKRQEAKKAELGDMGLAQMAEKLKVAVAHNETPIPNEHLTVVPIPAYASVRSIPLLTIRGAETLAVAPNSGVGVEPEKAASILSEMTRSFDGLEGGQRSQLSGYWHEWAHIETQFVSAAVALDTSILTPEQRLLLPLVAETAFKLPCALEDGTNMTKDEVVTGLQADTVRYAAGPGGIRGGSSQLFTIFIQVELDGGRGLALALKWIRRVMYLTQLTPEQLTIAAQRHLSQIPAAARNGHAIANALASSLSLDVGASNSLAAHAIKQQPYLTKLLEQLGTPDGAASVLKQMADLRAALLTPERVNIFVAADLTAVTDPYATLAAAILPPASHSAQNVPPTPPTPPTGPFTGVSERLIASGKTGQVVLVALSAIETHFVVASAPGLGVYSPDHAALLVAIEYLTALEGDFWVKLRGAGLTYSYFSARDNTARAEPAAHPPTVLTLRMRALVLSPCFHRCREHHVWALQVHGPPWRLRRRKGHHR